MPCANLDAQESEGSSYDGELHGDGDNGEMVRLGVFWKGMYVSMCLEASMKLDDDDHYVGQDHQGRCEERYLYTYETLIPSQLLSVFLNHPSIPPHGQPSSVHQSINQSSSVLHTSPG